MSVIGAPSSRHASNAAMTVERLRSVSPWKVIEAPQVDSSACQHRKGTRPACWSSIALALRPRKSHLISSHRAAMDESDTGRSRTVPTRGPARARMRVYTHASRAHLLFAPNPGEAGATRLLLKARGRRGGGCCTGRGMARSQSEDRIDRLSSGAVVGDTHDNEGQRPTRRAGRRPRTGASIALPSCARPGPAKPASPDRSRAFAGNLRVGSTGLEPATSCL